MSTGNISGNYDLINFNYMRSFSLFAKSKKKKTEIKKIKNKINFEWTLLERDIEIKHLQTLQAKVL